MNVLSIETAGQTASLAIRTTQQVRLQKRIEGVSEHARCLLPVLDALLQEAQCKISDVHALVVNEGPGSFTGLRVGASVVKALAVGRHLPIYPVSSLAALAAAAIPNANALTLAALDARMQEVYAQYFYQGKAVGDPVVTRIENLAIPNTTATALHLLGEVWLEPLHADALPTNSLPRQVFPLVLDALMLMDYFEKTPPAAVTAAVFEPNYVRDNIIQGAARG